MQKTTLAFGAAALALSIVLTGCATTETPSNERSSASASNEQGAANAADIMFVTMMIPHHEQAVQMADIVLKTSDIDPGVREVAENVAAAQQPEIDRMLSWLESWGVEYDPDAAAGHGAMGGMLSEDDLTALAAADPDTMGQLFLSQMIEHHEGAVEMARAALDGGSNADVIELAEQVVADQTAEIAAMQDLLARR
ncbi:uncharacterized protein (DUF305 family) [Leucobacter komagatae]|uniref:Uncharacterized protein (DUF305 family) n=1 Tax=Leucobacter komagatae TaxID=55969 RepID=A0A542Y4L5_9MICO|nr:DUF305 domain-containing protein [Leucobacter komagatae]TQL43013.1 uncharacterized protein (DUF305 family) [Leucobacter komagatae]